MDGSRLFVFCCCIQGVVALEGTLTGLIIAGVIAGGVLVVGLITVSVWCFVRRRSVDDDKEALDIISPKGVTPRYNRFHPTMKYRSYGGQSTSRPPVTFFTVRNDASIPRQHMPMTAGHAPYLFEPRGPVMYVDEEPVSARSSLKERSENYHRKTNGVNGHIGGSIKIREVHSGEEMMNFESSDDENGNKKKTIDNRSRSKSRDRKYIRNHDHTNHHRYRTNYDDNRRSRSNSRNRSESRHSDTITAQPGDIILNPSNFDAQPLTQPPSHIFSATARPESTFVPVLPAFSLSKSEKPSLATAFQPYIRNNDQPQDDYLTPRSITDMPSTITAETPRSDYITPTADYPRNNQFVYPPKPNKSSTDPFISPRPPTPEFDADSILYADRGQIRPPSPIHNVMESTPRSPPAAPSPPPIPGESDYLSATNRPPTPIPGLITQSEESVSDILNQESSNEKSPTKSISTRTSMGVSPLHNAMIAEIKNRRQRRPSDEPIVLLPSPSSGESSPSENVRRPSGVQFVERPPEIIPREFEPESPDFEPGSVAAVFDYAMNLGTHPLASPPPPPPPPPPPLPPLP